MHQLTGDFYTVGMILGHSLKGTGIQLGISTNLEAMTAPVCGCPLGAEEVCAGCLPQRIVSESKRRGK